MSLQKSNTNNVHIESIFEKKEEKQKQMTFWQKFFNTNKSKEVILSEKDKKVLFLLEKNFLLEIAKMQDFGHVLNENHKNIYNKKLYDSISQYPEETIRSYLLNGVEIPHRLLAIAFIIEMQEKKTTTWQPINKVISSFVDKVKKGLETDPVAKYKMEKLNDKQFINDLFDVWLELGLKHLNDIENQVTNKIPFLFFKINKFNNRLQKDLDKFIETNSQNHILSAESFFGIPFNLNEFNKNLSMGKILEGEKLIQKNEDLYIKIKNFNNVKQVKILNGEESKIIFEVIEAKTKEHYQKEIFSITNNKAIVNKVTNAMPQEALLFIKEIQNISKNLYEKDLNKETREIIVSVLETKIPEISENYLNIDMQYRESLKNIQGKSAKDLMIESLSILKESLENIEQSINEEKLKILSIQTRYIKNTLK